MIKVIHLLNTNSFSGAENMACQIIKMQNSEKVEAIYASPDGKIREKLEDADIEFIPLNNMSIREIRRKILSQNPDIIHAHDFRATIIAVITTIFSQIKVISHIHSDFDTMAKISFRSLSLLLSFVKVSKIIWVSKQAYLRYFFQKIVATKSIVLENTIDCSSFVELSDTNKEKNTDLVFLGRLEEVKDPLRFLSIVKAVLNQKKDLKVKIIGDGSLREKIKKYIYDNHLKDSVELCGFVNEPHRILADCKLLMLTSINEGLPMVILEAFALGVPVVSTAVGKIPNIINQDNGFCSNDNEELTKFIVSYLNNINLQMTLSVNAKKYFHEHFSYKKYKQQMEELYDEVLRL